ncbi:hypothetical protein K438DRAFT_1780061 [Mycena galopus ATCC 62051]|nr:hypothetical protein K438DRAFT_1780061 [Mycena galopus ATCC 62051]
MYQSAYSKVLATILLIVGDGYTVIIFSSLAKLHLDEHVEIQAFETAHRNMEIISNNSAQMPEVIATIVNLVLKGSAQDISDLGLFRTPAQPSLSGIRVLKHVFPQICENASPPK